MNAPSPAPAPPVSTSPIPTTAGVIERHARPHTVLLIVASAMFMEQLDGTVLATALPTMARSFTADPLQMNVALTSYLLTLAMFIPASGRIADRFGSRSVFRAAIGLFTLGSMLCAQAPTLWALVAARMLQGAGGAMMSPVGPAGDAACRVEGGTGAVDGLADGAGDHRSNRRPAGRRLYRHLPVLALDLLHQRPDRHRRHRPGDGVHRRDEGAGTNEIRPARAVAVRHRAGLPDVRNRGRQPRRRLSIGSSRRCCGVGAGSGGAVYRSMPGTIRGRCWIFACCVSRHSGCRCCAARCHVSPWGRCRSCCR